MIDVSCHETLDSKVESLPAVGLGRRRLACQRRQQVGKFFPD